MQALRFASRARLRRRSGPARIAILHQFAFSKIPTRDVIVDGRRVETAFIAGAHDAPALVFLHEGLGSIAAWRDFPQAVSDATGLGALLYSRYGNGFSEPLEQPRTVQYMHDEALTVLPALLAHFDIDRTVLIGHSDGASIALIYAGEWPQKVRAVVTMAPHLFVENLSVHGIAQARSLYETSDLRERLARHHVEVDTTFYGWNDIWLHPSFASWNIRSYAARVSAPVLAIQGEDDEYGTFAQIDALAHDARGGVDRLLLAHCAHAPHRDRPDIVTSAIAAFLTNVP